MQGHSAEIAHFSHKAVTVIAFSKNCSIQALSYLNHAFFVQFHPEVVNKTIEDWISIPKIRRDFNDAIGKKSISKAIECQQRNRRSLINGVEVIYQNWLNLIDENLILFYSRDL